MTTTATATATRHFVEYFYPGFPMLNVSSPHEIVERKVTELPEGAIGYRFFDGTPDDRYNVSGRYYKGQKVEWQQMNEKLEATDDPYETGLIEKLLLKMDGQDIVVTEDDQMFWLCEGDTVI